MATWRPGRTSLTRTARVATLYQPAGLMQRPVMILIEPKVTHLPIDGEVWLGTELKTTDAGVREIEQAWLVRPRGKDCQPLPPFDLKRWREISIASADQRDTPIGKGWTKPRQRYDESLSSRGSLSPADTEGPASNTSTGARRSSV
jgi:hypothetical protein